MAVIRTSVLVSALLPTVLLGGCTRAAPPEGEVVIYTALDRQFSEPLLNEFTAQTGIRVRAKYDTE
ncbi:MAG: hypothetical protein KKB50_07340 [Planctomycetes bacterium]|nr:hypothetical protein [Planctomycetota bacterium]